jgi:hypothetical protein
VHVNGGDQLASRIAAMGWGVVRIDTAGADAAHARGAVVVSEEASAWDDARLAAAVAEQTHTQFDALRAESRKAAHDGKNIVGLLWMHLAALERAVAKGDAAEIKESVEQVKEETRAMVRLLDTVSALARRSL